MVELGRLAVSAAEAGLAAVSSGGTETEGVAALTEMVARHDARAPVVLAAADERIDRYRHPLPAGAEVRRRLMLVLVVERWGLHAAVTRIRELEPPDAELARRNQAAAAVLDAMHVATRPGATLGDVLAGARAAYREHGFADEWELHHQGGSIGYQSRERIAVPDDATPIEPGMAFAWNPSITGAKAEETLLLLPDGEQRIVTRQS
jgi:Xaa-Pro aminopeptidase